MICIQFVIAFGTTVSFRLVWACDKLGNCLYNSLVRFKIELYLKHKNPSSQKYLLHKVFF